MSLLKEIEEELKSLSNPEKAVQFQRFFKTNKGDYGYGDVFLGIPVPLQRKIVKKYYKNTSLSELKILISSSFHEYRLTGLLILVEKFKRNGNKDELVSFYLSNTENVNNWDLVDLSADRILGEYLFDKKKFHILNKLCDSGNLWKQRIAVISTFAFIKKGYYKMTFELAEKLLNHDHDLIHKAVGWMLREIGKRDILAEKEFLNLYYKSMPRTMLRYSIEKFPEEERQRYLKGFV